jgi:hypothetical protein
MGKKRKGRECGMQPKVLQQLHSPQVSKNLENKGDRETYEIRYCKRLAFFHKFIYLYMF